MARRKKRRRHLSVPSRRTLPGAPPGTLTDDPDAPKPLIRATRFAEASFAEQELKDVAEIQALAREGGVLWVDVAGLGDAEVIRAVGAQLGLHALALEDVLNVHQRPKLEDYDDVLFIVLRQAHSADDIASEQISLFLGKNFVVTFQEDPHDWFDPVRERLRRSQGRLRREGADYLVYALIDAIVDHYFPLLERTGDRLDALEDEVVKAPRQDLPKRLLAIRHDLLALRRVIWPLREVLASMYRDDTQLISPATRVYLRDCYDHVVQLIDVLESHREVPGNLMDVYLSTVSQRLNEVMKVLTVIATVFIPLTFVSSIYGMNFDPDVSGWNMPELRWHLGYPFALVLMLLIAVGLLYFFRRRGWLGGEPPSDGPPHQ